MKIVYIAKFDKFYKTGCYVAYAFEKIDVEVIRVSPDVSFTTVQQIIIKHNPDFVLYGKSMKLPRLIMWLKSKGIPSVFWLYDMAWGDSPVAVANRYHIISMDMHKSDLFFSTDGGHDNEWRSLGVRNLTLRQGIHKPDNILVPIDNMDLDVVFTGFPYFPLRAKMINFLKDKYGKKFLHVEEGLRGLQLNRVVQSAKIVVADSYPSPFYWSNRIYEMTGRGGFVIHSDVDGLEQEFNLDLTTNEAGVVTFKYDDNFEDLGNMIDFYLYNYLSRELIRMNGFNQCPTYDDRIAIIIKYVAKLRDICKD